MTGLSSLECKDNQNETTKTVNDDCVLFLFIDCKTLSIEFHILVYLVVHFWSCCTYTGCRNGCMYCVQSMVQCVCDSLRLNPQLASLDLK